MMLSPSRQMERDGPPPHRLPGGPRGPDPGGILDHPPEVNTLQFGDPIQSTHALEVAEDEVVDAGTDHHDQFG